MIKIIAGRSDKNFLDEELYYKGKSFLTRQVMKYTKCRRANIALGFLAAKDRHLDIGCGDGYFAKRSPCNEIYAVDAKYGDHIDNKINFPDSFFDFVSMLAVIEHLEEAFVILREIHRILKKDAFLILTTPKRRSEFFIKLYVPGIKDYHEHYYDYDSMNGLCSGFFKITAYQTFLFGLNQLFILKKIEAGSA